MKKAGFCLVVLGVILIGVLGTTGLAGTANTNATATVTIAESTTLSVTTNNLTFNPAAFDTTPIVRTIVLNATTNKHEYDITAAANTANFSTADGDLATIARNQLEVESSAPAYAALPFGSTVEVVTDAPKTGAAGTDHTVNFQFTPTGNEAAGTYMIQVNFVLTTTPL